MMENRSPLTSPDGSSKRNTPERCPRPLYSRDSTQERHEIPQTRPLYSRDSTQERHEIPQTRPLYSRDSTQEHHEARQGEQKIKVKQEAGNLKNIKQEAGNLKNIKQEAGNLKNIKQEAEEPSVISNKPCKEEEIPIAISTDPGNTRGTQRDVKTEDEERQVKAKRKFLEIGMDGRYRWYNMEKCSDNQNVDDDITAYMTKEKALLPKFQPVCYKEEKPYSCPECGKSFTHEKYFVIHYRSHSGEKPYYCTECGKSFSQSGTLNRHKLTHSHAGGYYCPECGQRFPTAWFLAAHRKVHSSENVQR